MTGAFLQAAASHLGMTGVSFRRAEVVTDGGEMVAVFEVLLGEDDIIAIAERMKQMRAGQQLIETKTDVEPRSSPTYEEIVRSGDAGIRLVTAVDDTELKRARDVCNFGAAWDAMNSDQHAVYRSRYNYLLYRARVADEQVQGVTSNADDFGGMPG